MSSSDASSRWAASLRALGADLPRRHGDRGSRHRCAPGSVCAHTEGGGVGVALLDDDVLGGDTELVGDDLRPCRLVALPLGLGARPQQRLAGHVNPQLCRVEHLDAQDVVLAAVAGTERLGHRRDPDAEQTPLLLRLLLLFQEVLVADRFEPDVETLGVLPRVCEEPECGAVREVVVRTKFLRRSSAGSMPSS